MDKADLRKYVKPLWELARSHLGKLWYSVDVVGTRGKMTPGTGYGVAGWVPLEGAFYCSGSESLARVTPLFLAVLSFFG